jgi:hypothetical protein
MTQLNHSRLSCSSGLTRAVRSRHPPLQFETLCRSPCALPPNSRCLPTSRCAAPLPSPTPRPPPKSSQSPDLLRPSSLSSPIPLSLHRVDREPMEAEALVLAPQPAVSPPAASPDKKALAAAPTSALKTRATRRKTLCDITNLSRREPAEVPNESACPAPEKLAQLVKARSPIHHRGLLIAISWRVAYLAPLPSPLLRKFCICFRRTRIS